MTAQNRRAHTRRARAAAAAAEGNDNPERAAPPLLRPLLTFAEIRAALSCLPDGDRPNDRQTVSRGDTPAPSLSQEPAPCSYRRRHRRHRRAEQQRSTARRAVRGTAAGTPHRARRIRLARALRAQG